MGEGPVAPGTCFPLHPWKRDAVAEVRLCTPERRAGVPFQSALGEPGATRFVGGFDQGKAVDAVLDSKHWGGAVVLEGYGETGRTPLS